MRIRIFIALFALLPVAAVAQSQSAPPSGVYRVHKLTLKSTDLSRPMRQNIVHAFQGRTYNVDELSERVRLKLRESGYEFAEVNDVKITRPRHAQYTCDADFTFEIHARDQYRLSGITFTADPGGTVFLSLNCEHRSPLRMALSSIQSSLEKELKTSRTYTPMMATRTSAQFRSCNTTTAVTSSA